MLERRLRVPISRPCAVEEREQRLSDEVAQVGRAHGWLRERRLVVDLRLLEPGEVDGLLQCPQFAAARVESLLRTVERRELVADLAREGLEVRLGALRRRDCRIG